MHIRQRRFKRRTSAASDAADKILKAICNRYRLRSAYMALDANGNGHISHNDGRQMDVVRGRQASIWKRPGVKRSRVRP